MICTQCGKSNDDMAKFCSACGHSLSEPNAELNVHINAELISNNIAIDSAEIGSEMQPIPTLMSDPAKYIPPLQEKIETPTDSDELYKAIIGSNSQAYYLRQFHRFDQNGKAGASWHWPALFISFYWLLYRKMWLGALIYFVLPYIILSSMVLTLGMIDSSGALFGIGYILYLIGLLFLPPIYANALYYKHCKKKIAEAAASSNDVQRQLGELTAKGGTSYVVIIFMFTFVLLAIVGILAAIAIPAYQDYTTKARVAAAVSNGNVAATAVASYYEEHQQIPSSLAEANYVAPSTPGVKEIMVDSADGKVIITMDAPPISGQTILIMPSMDENSNITWTCVSEDIKQKYLPKQCRQEE